MRERELLVSLTLAELGLHPHEDGVEYNIFVN